MAQFMLFFPFIGKYLFSNLVFSLNTFFAICLKNHKNDMDPSIANHAAKSLSWSGFIGLMASLLNYLEVKRDGYYVSDYCYSGTWNTCRSPAHNPEQVV